MKLIIEIPEELRIEITRIGLLRISDEKIGLIDRAIQCGTVLSEHGRLGDLDYLYKKFEANGCKDSNVYRLIKDEPTIIEATGVEECTHTQ